MDQIRLSISLVKIKYVIGKYHSYLFCICSAIYGLLITKKSLS